MGTYGTATGVVRWFDPVNKIGHFLVLSNGEVQTDITGEYWASGATGYDEGEGFWLERPAGIALINSSNDELLISATESLWLGYGMTRLFVGNAAGNKMTWDGTNLSITGTIYAGAGDIGGWTINATYLAKDTGVDATSAGMAPLDYPFYGGATYANRASGTFRVNAAGQLVAEDATIDGTVNVADGNMVLGDDGIVLHDVTGASIITPTFGVGVAQNVLTDYETFHRWTAGGGTTVDTDAETSPVNDASGDGIHFPSVADSLYEASGSTYAIGTTGYFTVWLKGTTTGTVTIGVKTHTSLDACGSLTAAVTTEWRRFSCPFTSTGHVEKLRAYIERPTGGLTYVAAWGANLSIGVSATPPYIPLLSTGVVSGIIMRGSLYMVGIDGDKGVVVGNSWSTLPTGDGVYIGAGAGDGTGGNNTVVGYYAGAGSTLDGDSVLIGNSAGASQVGSNDYVIAIGTRSAYANAYSSIITIGHEAVATAANQLVAGTYLAPIYDVFIGNSVASDAPHVVTYHAPGGLGTNIAGAKLQLAGGMGTGTGAGGAVVIRTAPAGSTGSSQNSLVDRITVTSAGLTNIGDGGTTNYASFAADGTLTLYGTARYERHVQLDAKADGTVGNQPTQVDLFTAGGLQYPTTGSKNAFCQWEVPDDWDGTDVYFEVDWFPDSGAMSGTDAVRWTVEYRAIAEGEAINNGTSVTLDNGAGGDTADYSQYQTKHTRVTLTYNNANQPLTKQDHVYFKISRDTSVANDFGGSVTVTAYEIIYTSTGFPTSN